MARPDAALLNAARYPFSCAIEPRFGDVDVNQHINNAAMASLIEEARVRFHYHTGMVAAMREGFSTLVASLDIAFVGQAFYPAPLEARVAPSKIGRSSYTLDILMLQNAKPVTYAETVLVCIGEGGPAPVPSAWTANLDPWMLRP